MNAYHKVHFDENKVNQILDKYVAEGIIHKYNWKTGREWESMFKNEYVKTFCPELQNDFVFDNGYLKMISSHLTQLNTSNKLEKPNWDNIIKRWKEQFQTYEESNNNDYICGNPIETFTFCLAHEGEVLAHTWNIRILDIVTEMFMMRYGVPDKFTKDVKKMFEIVFPYYNVKLTDSDTTIDWI